MSQIAKRDTSSSRIPELDGLRGAAIAIVIFYHFINMTQGAPLGSSLARFQRIFSMGWAGVDLFFVLSGFLIGGILLNVRSSSSYFQTFYLRRFFRIIPVYYVWIFGYMVLVAVVGNRLAGHEITSPQSHLSIVFQFLFLQNFKLGQYTGLAIAWFAPTWSLAVEEQFYLVSPFLVRFLSTKVLSIFLAGAVLLAPLFRLFVRSHVPEGYYLAYALTPSRVDALAFGMLAAIVWRDAKARQWISSKIGGFTCALGVMFIGLICLWKWSSSPLDYATQTLGFSLVALFSTTLLLVILTKPTGILAWIARLPWLREFGRVSYCMYIIHEAINLFCHTLLLRSAPQVLNLTGALTTILAMVLTYGIAKTSWILLEHPLLKYGHGFQYDLSLEPDQNFRRIVGATD